nr:hypothetical protein [Escherichia coli]
MRAPLNFSSGWQNAAGGLSRMENYLLKISPQSDLAPRTKPAEQTHPGLLGAGIVRGHYRSICVAYSP